MPAKKKIEKQPKEIDPIDYEVGRRLRQRRIEIGISQEALGETLGLTFQQVQKYEKGTNRIAPSRLITAAKTLKVPPSYFFDGVTASYDPTEVETARSEFLATSHGAALVRAMSKLKPELVRAFTRLAERIVED